MNQTRENIEQTLSHVEQIKREWEVMVDSLPELVCLLDKQRRIIRTNRTVERLTVYSVLEVRQKGLHSLLHPDCDDPDCYLNAFLEQAWSAVKTGCATQLETRDDILDRYLHFHIRPVWQQSNGQAKAPESFAVAIIYDITDRKKAEESLQKSHDILEQRVANRTVELEETNQKLRKEIARRKRANQALRQAHDEVEMRVLSRIADLAEANEILQAEIIEREAVEQALRESEQRYKTLLGSVTDYIYTVNVENGRVINTTHSPYCVAVTGYTSEEYETDPHLWYRMIYEEDRPAVMEQADRLLSGEQIPPLEHRIIHKDGSIRWVRNTPVLRKDEAGQVVSYDGSITDITERKEAEEALRKSETKYRLLMEHASDGIAITDSYGNYLEVNSRLAEMVGYTGEDFRRLNVRDVMVEEDSLSLTFDSSDLQSGKTILKERRVRRKNGSYMPVEISARLIEENKLQAIIRDITERKEVERRERLAYELGRQLTTVLEPNKLLTTTVNHLKETFGYYHAQIYLFDDPASNPYMETGEKAVLVVQAATSVAGEEMKRRGHAIPLNARQSLVARAARLLEPVVVNDVSQSPDHLPNPLLPDTRSETAIPLHQGQRLIGVLDVQHTIVNHFDTHETRTLQIVANQLTVALVNAQLFAENARRLAILENSSDLIALGNLDDNRIVYINRAGAELIGYNKPQAMIGRSIIEFYPPDGQTLLQEEGLPTALKEDVWRGEHHLQRTDGELVPINQTIFVTHKERGQAQMLATIISDITQRKEAEEERERLFTEVMAGRERLQALSHRLVEVQEAERRHIARELHDEIGQLLTSLKLTLEMSARETSLPEAKLLVDELITHVRELSLELRPAMLDDLGLVPTLQWHFERFTAQTNVQVDLHHEGLADRRFTAEVETVAYRIIQQALTNIAQHAGTKEASIWLRADDETLSVDIQDQGRGFDPEKELAANRSSGLSGMQERAVLLGGSLQIESSPGSGTRLKAELPLNHHYETTQIFDT